MLFRSLAECLGFLRRVNPTESDSEEFIVGHERGAAFSGLGRVIA